MSKARGSNDGLVAVNRRAKFDYEIEDTFEAGLQLTGTEVKTLRQGKANIAEAYVSPEKGAVYLINADFPPYEAGNRFNHEPRRPRKLLLHKKEIDKLSGSVQREGRTIVPLKLYFNERGIAKLLIGLAKGKKAVDKRETKKERDWQRSKQRILKTYG
ncbi:SsrA-binding protein SmpB [Marinicauda algicola]|uniref:SsrA-binding protein n=1 Tax=Marinicauda algicola TaxID=2029849 RepID=A0A4S2GXG6_9PROT|nr:SsrA-binding protein SmpB [Marinicauda algicola]TGY87452.1 SsrA-binding protein SmpB [Marinicauda algicola]